MGQEIEVKVLDIDAPLLRERLLAAGCEPLGFELQENYMFDYADRRLYEQQDGSYIRLRRLRRFTPNGLFRNDAQAEQVILTFKQVLSRDRYKIAQETETLVGDFEQMRAFLRLLEVHQMRSDEKLRQSFRYEDILFEIDEWAGLPPYLEVEAATEDRVAFGLSLLGLSLQDATTMNLREVLAKYKIKASNLHFADQGRDIFAELAALSIPEDGPLSISQ